MFQNFGKKWHLFDVFGHPVYVSPTFLVLIAIFGFMGVNAQAGGALQILTGILTWAPILFVGILFHEIGHAVAIKHYGYGNSQIVLHGIGGVTINERRGHSAPKKSIVISLAGPFASFLTALLAFVLLVGFRGFGGLEGALGAGLYGFFENFLKLMGTINVIWAVFNLFPVNPLDGGHVVLHALRAKYGSRRKAMYYTSIVSLVALGVMVVVGLAIGLVPILLIGLAVMLGIQNYQTLQALRQAPPGGGSMRF